MPDFVKHVMWYTVWDAKTGELVAAGTPEMCAAKLGYCNANSFTSAVSHFLHDGRRHIKYTYLREYVLRSEVDSLLPAHTRGKAKNKKPSGVTSTGEPAKG